MILKFADNKKFVTIMAIIGLLEFFTGTLLKLNRFVLNDVSMVLLISGAFILSLTFSRYAFYFLFNYDFSE